MSPTVSGLPSAAANDDRRKSPSIKRAVWPARHAVIARHIEIVDLPSSGSVLVTSIELPDASGQASRKLPKSESYASASSGLSNIICTRPPFVGLHNNSLATPNAFLT